MRRTILGMLITVVSFGLLVRLVDWQAALLALKAASPTLVAIAVSCLVLSLAAKTVRWRLLLPPTAPVPMLRLYRILHISFLLNNVFPARLGDVARVAMTSRQPGLRLGHVLSSMLTERVTDTVTLLVGFLVVSPFLPLPEEYRVWLHVAWACVAALLVVVAAGWLLRVPIAALPRKLELSKRVPFGSRVADEVGSFGEGWRQLFARGHVLPIWGWSWAAWGTAFAINYLLMQALNIEAPITVAVLLTCTTNLSMLIPSSPGYVGVFHAAATLSLLPFGVLPSTAFSFAILAHIVNVVPVCLIGGAFLLIGHEAGLPKLRFFGRQRPADEPSST